MLRVITAIVLIPLVLIAVFKLPLWAFGLVVMALALLTAHEYLGLVAAHNFVPLRFLTYLTIISAIGGPLIALLANMRTQFIMQHAPVFSRLYASSIMWESAAPLLMLVMALLIQELSKALPSAAASYFAVPYIGLTLGFLTFLRASIFEGALLVFYLLIVVWIGDIAAYYVGKSIGKHLLAPRISPKKTWEGTIASIVLATIVGTLLLYFNAPLEAFGEKIHAIQPASIFGSVKPQPNAVWLAIIISACVNIAGQVGDLVESMIKRGANVKDSSALLPGHGGILDRIDALLLATPVLWYFVSFRLVHF